MVIWMYLAYYCI